MGKRIVIIQGHPDPDPSHFCHAMGLWLGTFPALLKGFFEQAFRYGFALKAGAGGRGLTKLLKGRSARVIVTMGMPATAYRLMFGAHGTKSLERGILWMAGFSPIRATLLGMVANRSAAWRARRLREIRRLGSKAA